MYPKERKEWRYFFDESKSIKVSCFPLQLKLSRLRRKVSDGTISEDNAVKEVWELCMKYQRAVESDLSLVFEPQQKQSA